VLCVVEINTGHVQRLTSFTQKVFIQVFAKKSALFPQQFIHLPLFEFSELLGKLKNKIKYRSKSKLAVCGKTALRRIFKQI